VVVLLSTSSSAEAPLVLSVCTPNIVLRKRSFFTVTERDPSLAQRDPDIARLIRLEDERQRDKLRMIPSENYASRAVLEACGSTLSNKYSEGYPRKRYYEGQQYIDPIEELARDRIKALFGVDHANVQPYSGSPANLAVYFAFCKPGDTVMGLGLPHGGHLTHGWSVSITGSYFKSVPYAVRRDDHRIDMDEVRKLVQEHKPRGILLRLQASPKNQGRFWWRTLRTFLGLLRVVHIRHRWVTRMSSRAQPTRRCVGLVEA
jgi:glycine hydroxymethyltransferase